MRVSREEELNRWLNEMAMIKHITALGRPLCLARSEDAYNSLQWFVEKKLFGGGGYSPEISSHIFALLSARLSLDPWLQSEAGIELHSEAVTSHLRWVQSWNPESRYFETTTQSEPVVAVMNAIILTGGIKNGVWRWTEAITRLFRYLLTPELVDRGRSGELVARLVCILARDKLLLHDRYCDPPSPNDDGCGGDEGEGDDYDANDGYVYYGGYHNISVPLARPFPVVDFLKSLLTEHDIVLHTCQSSPRQAPACTSVLSPTTPLNEIFGTGWMNFTHWVRTTKGLPNTSEEILELLHMLLYGGAALELQDTEMGFDDSPLSWIRR